METEGVDVPSRALYSLLAVQAILGFIALVSGGWGFMTGEAVLVGLAFFSSFFGMVAALLTEYLDRNGGGGRRIFPTRLRSDSESEQLS